MKLKHSLLTLLAAVMFPAQPVQATVDSQVVTFALSLRIQTALSGGKASVAAPEGSSSGDSLFTGSARVIRVGAKDIMRRLADLLEVTIPQGARFLVTTDGDVLIIARNGEVLYDVTEYFAAELDLESSIFSGFYNFETAQERSQIFFLMRFLINLSGIPVLGDKGPEEGGTQLELTGVAREDFSTTRPNANGRQVSTGKIRGSLVVDGWWDGMRAIGTGTVFLAGREVIEGEVDE